MRDGVSNTTTLLVDTTNLDWDNLGRRKGVVGKTNRLSHQNVYDTERGPFEREVERVGKSGLVVY